MIFFSPIFSSNSGAHKLFLKNVYPLFLENYQHLYKAVLAQSLPIVEFYHWLKYLHNFQSHPVEHKPFAALNVTKRFECGAKVSKKNTFIRIIIKMKRARELRKHTFY
jgi:hypothetical protein